MKKIFLLFCFSVFSISLFSQGNIIPQWKKVKTSSVNNGQAEGWAVDTDAQGNIYWPASFDSTGTLGYYDFLVYKFDANGNSLWATPYYQNDGQKNLAFVANAADTFLYVGGQYCTVNNFECDMFITKINKLTGLAALPVKTIGFGTGGYDEMDAIVPMTDGIYCGGWCELHSGSSGDYEMGFLKLSYNLNLIDSAYFGNKATNRAEHQDGHFVVDNNYVYASGLWDGNFSINNMANGQAIIGKFDKSNFMMVDTNLFGHKLPSNFVDLQNALGMTTDGNYLYVTGYNTDVNNDFQLFYAKFDKNLNEKWYYTWGGTDGEAARGIKYHNGKIYVAGVSSSTNIALNGGFDAVLLQIDTASGALINFKIYGDTLDNEFRDLALNGNNIYISGTSGENLFSGGSADEAFLIKTDVGIFSGIEEESAFETFDVFPNPSSEIFNVEFKTNAEETVLISLVDVHGKIVWENQFNSVQERISIDSKKLSDGIYNIYIISSSYLLNKKIMIKH